MIENKKCTGDAFYSEKYAQEAWREERREDACYLIDQVRGIISFPNNGCVLDVGCGSGDLGLELKKQFSVESYGIELNETAIQYANERGVKSILADLDEVWPYQNEFFDVVTGTEIIEHIVNPDHFILEAKRVLKLNGLLVLTTPNMTAWFNRALFLFGYQPFFTEVSTIDKTLGLGFTRKLTPNREPVGHIRCFTLKAIREILELHGFDVVLVKGNTTRCLPKFMKLPDRLFRFSPSLSSNITIVGRKKL
jgi:SAM-dependent methyltransferase